MYHTCHYRNTTCQLSQSDQQTATNRKDCIQFLLQLNKIKTKNTKSDLSTMVLHTKQHYIQNKTEAIHQGKGDLFLHFPCFCSFSARSPQTQTLCTCECIRTWGTSGHALSMGCLELPSSLVHQHRRSNERSLHILCKIKKMQTCILFLRKHMNYSGD